MTKLFVQPDTGDELQILLVEFEAIYILKTNKIPHESNNSKFDEETSIWYKKRIHQSFYYRFINEILKSFETAASRSTYYGAPEGYDQYKSICQRAMYYLIESPTMDGTIRNGSIEVKDGKVTIHWKLLVLLVLIYNGTTDFVKNYPELKDGVRMIVEDIDSVLVTLGDTNLLSSRPEIQIDHVPSDQIISQLKLAIREQGGLEGVKFGDDDVHLPMNPFND